MDDMSAADGTTSSADWAVSSLEHSPERIGSGDSGWFFP